MKSKVINLPLLYLVIKGEGLSENFRYYYTKICMYSWGTVLRKHTVCLFKIFKLRTEAYTSMFSLITDSLTDSSVRIMLLENLEKGEKSYSGQTLTGFQAASHLANAPETENSPKFG